MFETILYLVFSASVQVLRFIPSWLSDVGIRGFNMIINLDCVYVTLQILFDLHLIQGIESIYR